MVPALRLAELPNAAAAAKSIEDPVAQKEKLEDETVVKPPKKPLSASASAGFMGIDMEARRKKREQQERIERRERALARRREELSVYEMETLGVLRARSGGSPSASEDDQHHAHSASPHSRLPAGQQPQPPTKQPLTELLHHNQKLALGLLM